ncbi:AraC family transcriptional regulator [Dyella sp. BiH032]|uniref:AraC family transcriptional regulator n=1 Tax=Dyella sp. BiH032 TaxID=3075430 RepID=UPI0028933143|nr:AraC family transcriptional regulator [Dyella sp. BiH032]WNL44403.1 AraC family transcriptional regulator [Dyella sp. BiH032]
MIDPLAEVVALLQPGAPHSKIVSAFGSWRVRRSETGQPYYCVVLEGSCRLAEDGRETVVLQAGDFVLIPAAYGFTMSSAEPPAPGAPDSTPLALPGGEFQLGEPDAAPKTRLLIGYCVFGSPDAALLVSLLPQRIQVRGEPRLATLVRLVVDESRERRPARDMMLARLLEALLIEALRSSADAPVSPGLLRGLADTRLAHAIRRIHEAPAQAWTVAQLAKEAALSRSAFFERFSRAIGLAPMEYLLAWRMALAKRLLRQDGAAIAEVAERVGYSSASTFSVAFARHVGMPPARFARERPASQEPA